MQHTTVDVPDHVDPYIAQALLELFLKPYGEGVPLKLGKVLEDGRFSILMGDAEITVVPRIITMCPSKEFLTK